jgi:hypothetical protein
MASSYEIGERTFTAPKSSDRYKLPCKVCKLPLKSKPYVMALREGPDNVAVDMIKDVARIHEACLND